jgi:hypothetical protein
LLKLLESIQEAGRCDELPPKEELLEAAESAEALVVGDRSLSIAGREVL